MKKFITLAFVALFCLACDSETERTLSTDLQVEGTEVFNISLAFEESLYFGLLSLDDYRIAERDSISLPGCPILSVDNDSSQVRLTFQANPACDSQKLERNGSILINFSRNTSTESIRTLIYDDYSIKGIHLDGDRSFTVVRNGSPASIQESFTNLRMTNPRGSTTRISGNFSHQLQLSNRQLIGFTSTGQLSGINIAGREFTMQQTSPRQYLTTCLLQGNLLAQQGVERWSISRGQNKNAVQHTLTFSLSSNCETNANLSLSDGRSLSFKL
ncbi:hypothetical protein [Mongoliitalea daihaiensis]|uniref:hypothetical protein n=1 Tax=Mongoliitalea daihaiensis TaxID=2782006 RepID=UPI001F27ED6E|nr:hypothetical protein [Mongoliitalea daihaiensis]UJP65018.1 hypothetical protein IPZ59_19945 [Mongoliitalea daihaiensis]